MGLINFLSPATIVEAQIRVVVPSGGTVVNAKFILSSFKLTKTNEFAEIKIPGLGDAPIQFVTGHSRVLSMVLYFDERRTGTDVRDSIKGVLDLMKVDGQTHAPPVLQFEWQGLVLKCVLESMTEEFVSLFPDGRPSRGKAHVTFKETEQLQQMIK